MSWRRAIFAMVVLGLAGASLPAAAAGLSVRDRLTWTHRDGTPVVFGSKVRVWCGPWASDVPVPSIHVHVGGRAPRWELHAVVADVKRRPVVRLPNVFVFDRPKGAQLFATDGRDEVNSDEDDSTGRIRFQAIGCGARPRIAFSFRGRVGSEFIDGEPLTVRGSFRAFPATPRVCRRSAIQQQLIDAGRLTRRRVKLGEVIDLVRCGDVTADGRPDAVFTVASGGTAGDTRFGVLRGRSDGAPGTLVLYRQGYKVGIARRDRRSFEVLQPHYGPSDPNCCPSSFRLRRYTWTGSRFTAGAARKLKSAPARFYRR